MSDEIWKPIIGYEGLYEISNLGRVRSIPKKGFKKQVVLVTSIDIATGYECVNLSKQNKRLRKRVHRLVAEVFLTQSVTGKPLCVNHKDGNKRNNRLENLEWVTYQENSLHAVRLGLTPIKLGEAHNSTKYSDKVILKLYEYFEQGYGPKEVSDMTGIPLTTVSGYRTGRKKRAGIVLNKEAVVNNSKRIFHQHLTRNTVELVEQYLKAGYSRSKIQQLTGVGRKSKLYTKLLVDDIS